MLRPVTDESIKASVLQLYAVSALYERSNGKFEHSLHVMEASSQDAAEGRVIAQGQARGEQLRGLLSRSCVFDGEAS
jgi:hypothetical protein